MLLIELLVGTSKYCAFFCKIARNYLINDVPVGPYCVSGTTPPTVLIDVPKGGSLKSVLYIAVLRSQYRQNYTFSIVFGELLDMPKCKNKSPTSAPADHSI